MSGIRTRDVRNEFIFSKGSSGIPIDAVDREKSLQDLINKRYDLLCPTCGKRLNIRKLNKWGKPTCKDKKCTSYSKHNIY